MFRFLCSGLSCSFLLPERLISSVTELPSSSTLLNKLFLLFHLHFSIWNLELLIVALSIKTFLSVSLLSFSCGVLAHMLSHTLTTVFSVFSSLLYFPGPWSTGSSAPGLRVSGHRPSAHSCWMPRCRLKYFFCFVGLEIMSSCLSVRHIYWWSSMYRNNSSLFGFWSLILGEDPHLWNLTEGSTFLQSWARYYLQGVTFFFTFPTVELRPSVARLTDLWESHLKAGQAQARCRQSLNAQPTVGSQ